MQKLKDKMHIGHSDKDKTAKGQGWRQSCPFGHYLMSQALTDDTPASAPKEAPEPLSNTTPDAPSKDAEIVPTGVTSNIGNEGTGQEATTGNESLDSIPGDIPAPPPHIAQRLEEHREQVSALNM